MDQLMWVVTFVALSLAVGMSVVAVRLLGGDRRRRAARVAALASAAFDLDDEAQTDEPLPRAPDVPAALRMRTLPLTHHHEVDEQVEFDLAGLRAQAPAFDEYRAEGNAAMFAATEEPKAPSRRRTPTPSTSCRCSRRSRVAAWRRTSHPRSPSS